MREGAEIVALVGAGLLPCAAYLALGLRLAPRAVPWSRGAERLALAWALGTGAASLVILVLRAVGIPVALLTVGIGLALAWPLGRQRGGLWPPSAGDARAGWVRAVDRATGFVAALLLLSALGPETYWDGFEYHLPLVAAWTEAPLRAVPGMIDAELRAGVDLLYVPALTAAQPDAAAAVSAGFALALAALVRAEATRRASAGAGALAGLLTLCAPLVVEAAASTYVDLGTGLYGFLALLLADRWTRRGESRDLWVAAVCLAFAANAKLPGAALVPAVAGLVWAGGRRPSLRTVLGCAALSAGLAAPWLLKSWLTTGNPLFPMLADELGTGPFDPRVLPLRRVRLLANYPVELGPAGLAQYLASITFGSTNTHVSGLLGALPLALAPLAWSRPARASLALVLVISLLVTLQFTSAPALRFGTPWLPFLALAAAVGGRRLAVSGAAARTVLVGALLLALGLQGGGLLAHHLPRLGALRAPAAHEARLFPDQDNLRRVVAQLPAVVGIPGGAVAWMPKAVYDLHWERNGELFFLPDSPQEPARRVLRERGVRSLVLDREPPLPGDGTLGHALVDAWIREGRARIARDVAPLPARAGRIWVPVLLDFDAE